MPPSPLSPLDCPGHFPLLAPLLAKASEGLAVDSAKAAALIVPMRVSSVTDVPHRIRALTLLMAAESNAIMRKVVQTLTALRERKLRLMGHVNLIESALQHLEAPPSLKGAQPGLSSRLGAKAQMEPLAVWLSQKRPNLRAPSTFVRAIRGHLKEQCRGMAWKEFVFQSESYSASDAASLSRYLPT